MMPKLENNAFSAKSTQYICMRLEHWTGRNSTKLISRGCFLMRYRGICNHFILKCVPVSQPLLSLPLLSGPQSGPPTSSLAPLPIPGYMPIKKPEVVVSQNMHQLKRETIGRLVTKPARSSYFGEDVLARSSVAGGGDKHPLDPNQLASMKLFLKSKFPQESPTDFKSTWVKCIESLNRVCNYLSHLYLIPQLNCLICSVYS